MHDQQELQWEVQPHGQEHDLATIMHMRARECRNLTWNSLVFGEQSSVIRRAL